MARLDLWLVVLALLGAGCAGDPSNDDPDPDPGGFVEVVCGDGACHLGEDCESCGEDCGECAESCYDDVCQLAEGCQTCPADCGRCYRDPPGDPEPSPSPDPAPDMLPSSWPTDWEEREAAMLVLVNALRTGGGDCPSGSFPPVAALGSNSRLREAARGHAADMAARGYFDHDGLDGRSPGQRMMDAGYEGSPRGENIAAGNSTAEDTFDQWQQSDGHCRNMMSASSDEIGIGYAYADGSPYRHYWVQNFGRQ